jgi:hypothetical protein
MIDAPRWSGMIAAMSLWLLYLIFSAAAQAGPATRAQVLQQRLSTLPKYISVSVRSCPTQILPFG